MMQEIAKKQKPIILRNGLKIWIDEENIKKMNAIITSPNCPKFLQLGERTINVNDLSGIFMPEDIKAIEYERRGAWKCEKGHWMGKNATRCEAKFALVKDEFCYYSN